MERNLQSEGRAEKVQVDNLVMEDISCLVGYKTYQTQNRLEPLALFSCHNTQNSIIPVKKAQEL